MNTESSMTYRGKLGKATLSFRDRPLRHARLGMEYYVVVEYRNGQVTEYSGACDRQSRMLLTRSLANRIETLLAGEPEGRRPG